MTISLTMAPIINIKININLSPLNLRLPSHSQSPSTVFEPPIDRGLRLSEPSSPLRREKECWGLDAKVHV